MVIISVSETSSLKCNAFVTDYVANALLEGAATDLERRIVRLVCDPFSKGGIDQIILDDLTADELMAVRAAAKRWLDRQAPLIIGDRANETVTQAVNILRELIAAIETDHRLRRGGTTGSGGNG